MTAIVILVAILTASVVAHEAGHALAYRGQGIRIAEAGIGLPFPPRLRLRWRGITWSLSPWLLGGYVRVSDTDGDRAHAMPHRDFAWHCNAGIIVNLVAGLILVAVGAGRVGLGEWLAVAAAVLVWVFRRQIAAYVLPALAVPMLGFVLWVLAGTWSQGKSGLGYAGLGELIPDTPQGWVVLAGVINLSLVVVNAMPLYPLDNGQVCRRLVFAWAGSRADLWFRLAGVLLVSAALIGSVVSDLWAAVT